MTAIVTTQTTPMTPVEELVDDLALQARCCNVAFTGTFVDSNGTIMAYMFGPTTGWRAQIINPSMVAINGIVNTQVENMRQAAYEREQEARANGQRALEDMRQQDEQLRQSERNRNRERLRQRRADSKASQQPQTGNTGNNTGNTGNQGQSIVPSTGGGSRLPAWVQAALTAASTPEEAAQIFTSWRSQSQPQPQDGGAAPASVMTPAGRQVPSYNAGGAGTNTGTGINSGTASGGNQPNRSQVPVTAGGGGGDPTGEFPSAASYGERDYD